MARIGLLAVLLFVLACAPAQAGMPPPLRFGLNDAPLFQPDPERALDLEAGLGSTVERLGIPWRTVQPAAGVWDWGYPDRAVGAAADHGMRVIAVISTPAPWASKHTFLIQCAQNPFGQFCLRPPAPEHLSDLARFAQAVALRYPTIAAIEVWNEPNIGQYNWQPEAEPEYYVEVLRTVNHAVDAVRPALPVISGGIGAPGSPRPSGSMGADEFLERMYQAGARGAMDGIGVHPYPTNKAPDDPEGSDRLMREVRAIRDAHGDGRLPLWVTETGYTTTGPFAVTPEKQAAWLAWAVRRTLRQRDVRAVVVNTLADRRSSDEEGGYGLVSIDLQPKPAYAAVAAAVREVAAERAIWMLKVKKRVRKGKARPRLTRKRADSAISISLSEEATVTLSFERTLAGRHVRGRCVKPRRSNRRAHRCKRYRKVRTTIRLKAKKGTNRVLFNGRLSRRRSLRPGYHRLTVVARNRKGAKSKPKRASFRLVPAKRKRGGH